MQKELVQIINKQADTDLPEDVSKNELQQKLTAFINELIVNDFQRLITILYRIDVDEKKLKRILLENAGTDAGEIIATLVIEREIQKIETRKQFGSKK